MWNKTKKERFTPHFSEREKKRAYLLSRKKNGGFTLIELMVVVFIFSIGVLGMVNLITQVFKGTHLIVLKLTAAYLAQEGVEIVRNIRDSNWLEQYTNPGVVWDDGIVIGDWEADYKSEDLSRGYFPNSFLNIDNDGFYSYSFGDSTKFQRRINIEKPTGDEIQVCVAVIWSERFLNYEVEACEKLYNWKP